VKYNGKVCACDIPEYDGFGSYWETSTGNDSISKKRKIYQISSFHLIV
jgi:hypothetical protein